MKDSSRSSRNKKKFTLPVTPFVRKILLSCYGYPLDVNQTYHREICTLLQLVPIINVEKKRKLLTSTVTFITPYNLAKAVSRTNFYALGVMLHSHYLYKMYEYIYMYAEEAKTMTALDALRAFFKKYNINDDDFELDSAYRGWMRYKASQKPLFEVSDILPIEETVQHQMLINVHDRLAQFKHSIDQDYIKLSELNNAFRMIDLKKYPLTAIHRVHYFLLKELCDKSYQQIGNIVNRPKSTVRYHYQKAVTFIESNHYAADLFKKILQNLAFSILPVLFKAVG